MNHKRLDKLKSSATYSQMNITEEVKIEDRNLASSLPREFKATRMLPTSIYTRQGSDIKDKHTLKQLNRSTNGEMDFSESLEPSP
jgi:hypothetical protein